MYLFCCAAAACNSTIASVIEEMRPNILLIVADDLGYADLGSYGSDIETPNLDALAASGVRFSRFYTGAMCAPSRAMLLSGNNSHVAGMAKQGVSGLLAVPYPGYENHLSDRVVPFTQLLRVSGYHTYIAGKWHLGRSPDQSPRAAGFERSFTLLDGAANHWSAKGVSDTGSIYREDGEVVQWPAGRYSTELYSEKLISFIDSNRGDGKPFFALAAFTSPHWPLQVPDKDLKRYTGFYDAGYDRQRELNFERLKAAGIIPKSSVLPPRNESITPWEQLDDEQQRSESRKMELYAAMVSNLDRHVGQLIDYLKFHGLYESTLIVFMSDNGAAGEDFYGDPDTGEYHKFVLANYDNEFENMGRPDSFVSYGPQWAEASSAPFQRYKSYTREGGIRAPMIAAGRGVSVHGEISTAYLTVMDLAPTFLELAGVGYPHTGAIQPMRGKSIADLLSGVSQTVHDASYVTVHSHRGRAYIRQGRWKLTNLEGPFEEADLELFDLDADPGETRDLAAIRQKEYQHMLELWRVERKALQILLPEDL